MSFYVIKRNGDKVPFDKNKIIHAVLKAAISANITDFEAQANAIAEDIEKFYQAIDGNEMSIEDISDLVEIDLYEIAKSPNVAKEYITYRYKRNAARQYENSLFQELNEKYRALNVQNQNANIDEMSFGGRKGEADSVVAKKMALDYMLSDKAKNHHLNNEIYIHDLDSYVVGMHNCLTIPFDDLLANGFNTRQTDVRPAGSLNTAFQLVAVIFQLQSLQQFGGCSASHIDWTMVPYVRKSFVKHYKDGLKYIEGIDEKDIDYEIENMIINATEYSIHDIEWEAYNSEAYKYALALTKKECDQAVEGMFHNLNTLQSRSGNQLPFTSINYGTCTLPEGRMVIESLLNNSIKGLGKVHRTSIFPCSIFQYMKGINDKPDTPNYDMYQLALKSTALRLYPNYVNVDWSGNAGYDRNDPKTFMSTMGCRTANGFDINGFKQLKDGRGNICPVTVILPEIAMQAVQNIIEKSKTTDLVNCEDNYIIEFMELLDQMLNDAKEMLIERFDWICSQPAASAKFMYENNTMAGYNPEEGIRSALKHGTLALGFLGMAECLQILIGQDQITEKGMILAKQILNLYKTRCAEFKQRYSLNFGVYATPAENLCYTAMLKFRKTHGVLPNISDHDYFTNSMHVPVWYKVSPFDKIDIESQLTGYTSAGCITYVELDSSVKNNIEALETIVNYAMEHDIPYFAINVPNDTCLDCGYTDEFNNCCPECGSNHIQQLRRVTGYLTGSYKDAFNRGKIQETEQRVKHVGIME